MKMSRNILMALAVSATFVSCGAGATGIDFNPLNHATKAELAKETKDRIDGDKANAGAIKNVGDQLNSAVAAGQAAYNQVQGQIGAVNQDLQDSKAAGAEAIGKTNTAVKAVDDKLNGAIGAGVAAYNELKGTQGQQQNQINAVQGAAQTANDRATHLEGRADAVEGAVRETNAQVAVTDARSINNAVRLDGVETNVGKNTAAIADHETRITTNTADIKSNTTTINQHSQQITTINQVNAQQQVQINNNTATNVRQDNTLNQHASAINSLDSRTTTLEDYSRDMDVRLGGRLDSQQSQISKNARDIKEAKNMAAAALAVAGQQFCTGLECGFQTAVSASTIGGSQALAIGMGGAVSENVFINAAFTKAGSVSGGVVSGTYRFK